MSVRRFVAILIIFAAAGGAWAILGGTIDYRTALLSETLSKEVDGLWGPSGMGQEAPLVAATGRPLSAATGPLSSDVLVRFAHHHRYKGLLWFSTYTVAFRGTYRVSGKDLSPRRPEGPVRFIFPLPRKAATLENLNITVDGNPVSARPGTASRNTVEVALPSADLIHLVEVTYETRGRDR